MSRKHTRVRVNNSKKSPERDGVLAQVLSKYTLPKRQQQRSVTMRHLADNPCLLSYLNAAADAIAVRFYDTNVYLDLELVGGTLTVVVRTDDGLSDYSMRLDEFECNWAEPALVTLNGIRFAMD